MSITSLVMFITSVSTTISGVVSNWKCYKDLKVKVVKKNAKVLKTFIWLKGKSEENENSTTAG